MKLTQRNFKKAMKENSLPKRKAMLESMALSICWHGGLWEDVMAEIKNLNESGVKTALQQKYINE